MIQKATLLLFQLFFFISGVAVAQSDTKVFFDRAGRSCSQDQAYYYRQKDGENYKSFYVNGGGLYFEGKISTPHNTDEDKNVYSGTCTWYYKNGKKKLTKTFNIQGVEDGVTTHYFESGKIWKEIEYKNGSIVNNSYKEYSEDGQVNRIFEEEFNNNSNDWDLYSSDKSIAKINKGLLELTSNTSEGTSRYISIPMESNEFTLEAVINITGLKANEKAGLIYGYKDWQNYNYFVITQRSFYIGLVYEGVSSIKAEGMYSGDIKTYAPNNLKIITNGEKNIYSINGSIQYTTNRARNFGSNVGFVVSGKSAITVDKMIYKDLDFKSVDASISQSDMDVNATGSGIIFSANGYILTNYHVVENSNKLVVEINQDGIAKSYTAILSQKDPDNDLAILKIIDDAYKPLSAIQYSFKESGGVEVGAAVYTIGYPYALSGMGKGAKFTDGKISAKTGYNNAINSYQTSIPVQPGNSGGPIFNEKAELIGIINAKIMSADNVSYSVKLNYARNIIDLLPETLPIPNDQSLGASTIENQIKVLSNYVVLIKVK